MILVLNIINKEQGTWLLVEKEKVKFRYDFTMEPSQDNLLGELDIFFQQTKTDFKYLTGLILFVQEASLTQVKVFTATLNTLGWQLNLPILGEFYSSKNFASYFPKLLKKLKKQKKFKPLTVNYKKKPLITISKKRAKYVVIK